MRAEKIETHALKIEERFADDICSGRKTFEVRREDDRRFAAGDEIAFVVVDERGGRAASHALCRRRYRIGYVLRGWGIRDGYAALAIEPIGSLERRGEDETLNPTEHTC